MIDQEPRVATVSDISNNHSLSPLISFVHFLIAFKGLARRRFIIASRQKIPKYWNGMISIKDQLDWTAWSSE